jgi:ethanolamine-phosphate phospho-lyase
MSIIELRNKYFPKCLYHSYNSPIIVDHAKEQYYNDNILDLYNNVCHVGHSNEKIQKIISEEYSKININTRYLNSNLTNYAEKLSKYLPKSKSYKILFVNSGSEANDLALRICMEANAKAINNDKNNDKNNKLNQSRSQILSMEYSYHGTTYLCDKVSHLYSTGIAKESSNNNPLNVKFLKRNSKEDIDNNINAINTISALIVETIQGVGGNFNYSDDYLPYLFERAKENNIITICDEVQTGFGRTGHTFWAFEYYGLVPDIITCGKPIANGYPMGCVIIREDLAELLGDYYFNTYGGNSVACKVALTVLEELEDRDLQTNSKILGDYLIEELNKLKGVNKVSGHGVNKVSGRGLYVGIELDSVFDSKYIVEKLRELHILVGIGANNIIRIKPPLVINKNNIDTFINEFGKLLN